MIITNNNINFVISSFLVRYIVGAVLYNTKVTNMYISDAVFSRMMRC